MGRILVTGATGFIGRHLIEALRPTAEVVAAIHTPARATTLHPEVARIPYDLDLGDMWSLENLRGTECVYHLAARVHEMRVGPDDDAVYWRHNVRATESLATLAVRAGVRRFIFLSSIKVNGERTVGQPFTPDGIPAPEDAYGRSKLAAERTLLNLSQETGLEVVIVRPPLVYGPWVGANFRRLMALVNSGWPLPFGSVRNRRSLVSVWNLVSLLVRLQQERDAPGKVWLVTDDDDVSTPALLDLVARGLGKARAPLMAVPVPALRALGAMTGRRREVGRLVDSLQVDVSQTCINLGWRPPMGVQEGVTRTAAWFCGDCRLPRETGRKRAAR